MKKRSTEIMQSLIYHEQKNYTLAYFAQKYAVSLRTIRNDIKEINAFIEKMNMPLLGIDENKNIIRESGFHCERLASELYNMNVYEYHFSNEERIIYIMISLIVKKHYISMQSISDELCVSRATISNDFEELRSYLTTSGTCLLSDAGKGISLECCIGEKVYLLSEALHRLSIKTKNESFFQHFIFKKLNIHYSFAQLFSCLQKYVRLNNLSITEDAFYIIAIYAFVMFNLEEEYPWERSNEHALLEDRNQLLPMLESAANQLHARLTNLMQSDFLDFVDKHKLSVYIRTVDEVELYKGVINFLLYFNSELDIDLTQDTALINSLLSHIRSMKDITNEEFTELPKSDDTLIDYEKIYALVSKHSDILEKVLHYQLSDNMKRSFVIHIGVSVIRHYSCNNELSVAIVCPGSMATGKYLEMQIRNYFDFKIAGVFSVSDIEYMLKTQQLNVSFIISTVNLSIDSCHVLKVKPFLDMKELLMIQKYAMHCNKSHYDSHKNYMRMCFLQQVAKARDNKIISPVIFDKIKEMLLQYEQETKHRKQNAIAQYLEEKNISFEPGPIDWHAGIKRAAANLIADGYITEKYCQQCIENVRLYGSYIIIGPDIALAHADKKYGIMKNCLSVLVAPKGITFDDGNMVRLMFVFSNQGENNYFDLIQSLMRVGRTDSTVDNICLHHSSHDVYEELIYV